MGVDEKERAQAILDAAVGLLLRHGYDKTTMSDVAEAAGLNRALIYPHFKSKDDLVEALIIRELNRYSEEWQRYLETDPLGGTVASLYRITLKVISDNPLRAAMHTQDEQTFGKYLRKPGNVFTRLPTNYLTRDFLQIMQDAGTVRQDVNIAAMAFILDALTPALLKTLSSRVAEARGEPRPSSEPTAEELMDTISLMLERMLTPPERADLAAGKAALRHGLELAQKQFLTSSQQQTADR